MGINSQPNQPQAQTNNQSMSYSIPISNVNPSSAAINGVTVISSNNNTNNTPTGTVIGTINNPINNLVNMNVQSPATAHQTSAARNTSNQNNTSNNNPMSLCCLIENGTKCTRNAGNASYSKRIEKQVAQKKLQLIVDPSSSNAYICEHHKQIIQSIRTNGKRKRKDNSNSGIGGAHNDDNLMNDEISMNDYNSNNANDIFKETTNKQQLQTIPQSACIDSYNQMVMFNNNNKYGSQQQYHQQQQQQQQQQQLSLIDFHSLQVNTLRKYKRHFRLPIKNASNKNQLADEIQRHFRTLEVNEKDVINSFIYMIKNNNNNNSNSNNAANNNGNSKTTNDNSNSNNSKD